MLFRRITYAILNLLLPQSTFEKRLALYTPELLSEKLLMREHADALVLFDYDDPLIKQLIWALKYRKNMHAVELCSKILADVLKKDMAQRKLFSSKPVLLVPIPLSPQRAWARGYNQMDLVLTKLLEYMDASEYAPRALEKERETTPQTGLSKAERLKNLHDAFIVPKPELLSGRIVYLFDDVTTTGTTLNEAKRALEQAGATVFSVALAH
ncbi:MAG TPA: phosphoribosyltransferase family protein [Candidatus Paceibacterota bacterium]